MTNKPTKTAKHKMGATGQTAVPKKATAVVRVVNNMAPAASGKALAAISCGGAFGRANRAFFHLSTATKTSSAPKANRTNIQIKLRNGKNVSLAIKT